MTTYPASTSSDFRLYGLRWLALPPLGLSCSLLGAGLAMVTVPEDPSPRGAIAFSGSAFAFFLLIPIAVATFREVKSAFHAVNIVAAAPVFWLLLDLVQSAYSLPGITQSDVQNAFLAIGLFSAAVWTGAMMPAWRLPNAAGPGTQVELSPRHLMIMATLAFALAFCRFVIPSKFDFIAMLQAFDGSRWDKPWSRGHFGGMDAFLDHFSYFGYALPTLAALLARKCGWLNRRTIATLAFAFLITSLMAVGGGRRIIGVMVGSGTLVYFLSSPRFTVRSLIAFTASIAMLLFIMQVIILYRNDGLSNAFSGDLQERLATKEHFHVDDNFLRLSQIVSIFPEQHPHTTWRYVLYIAVRPVPRALWQDKPMDAGFDLARFLGRNDVSFSSSVIGELFVSMGWLGCMFGGLFYGRLANTIVVMLERNLTNGALITYGIGLLAVFAGVRSAIDLVLMSYGVLGWLAVVYAYDRYFERLPSAMTGSAQVSR